MRTVDVDVEGTPITVELHDPNDAPARSVVMMVHGGPGGDGSGPAGLFAAITTSVTETGFSVARFNLRGSGAQPKFEPANATVQSGVEDVEAVFDALKAQGFDRIVLYAESMGATMSLLASRSPQFAASILLWPALNLFDTDLRDVLTPESLQTARSAGSTTIGDATVGVQFLIDCLLYDAGSALQHLASPVLVIHGDADEEVPCSHSIRAAAILDDQTARLVIVPGANHGLKQPHERDLVVSETLVFLKALS